MAWFETWFKNDLAKPINVVQLQGVMFNLDNLANKIGVELEYNGQPAALEGTIAGYVIRNDGTTLNLTTNTGKDGNKAWVILPQEAYTVEGPISIVIKLVYNSAETTIGACAGYVTRSRTSSEIAPTGTVIPSLASLEAAIAAANAAAINASDATDYIAPTEEDSTADAAHAVGSYFIYNGKLMKATSAIAQGATIVPYASGVTNYNCAEVPNGLSGEVYNVTNTANVAANNAADAQQLVAPVESMAGMPTGPATMAHAKGTYFVLHGMLYKATANIAQGATFVTSGGNANCELISDGLSDAVVDNYSEIGLTEAAIAPVETRYNESTSTASAAHATGSYFVYGGVLYKATSDIAIGDPIVTTGTGANAAQVPGGVTGEIADLKSALEVSMGKSLDYGILSGASINSSGRIVSSASGVVTYAMVYASSSVIVEHGAAYAFYTSAPELGAYSYNNSRTVQTLANTEVTIPSGIKYMAITSTERTTVYMKDGIQKQTADIDANLETLTNKVNDVIKSTLVSGFIPNANINAAGKIISAAFTIYYAPVFDFSKLVVEKGFVYAFFTDIPVMGSVSYNASRMATILDETEITVPSGVKYIGVGTNDGEPYIVAVGTVQESMTSIPDIQQKIEVLETECANTPQFEASDIAMFQNVGFCGDSYTKGLIVVSENPTVMQVNENLSWGKILERTHGINASIYAKGGATAASYITDSDCLPTLLSDAAKQLYVISLGHNDAYANTNVNNFKTSYQSIISQISAHAPNAKIILCMQSGPYAVMNNGAALNAAIAEIGETLGLPVLNPANDTYLSSDIYIETMQHNHPVFAGYAGLARAFNRQFAKATVDYHSYFADYTGL